MSRFWRKFIKKNHLNSYYFTSNLIQNILRSSATNVSQRFYFRWNSLRKNQKLKFMKIEGVILQVRRYKCHYKCSFVAWSTVYSVDNKHHYKETWHIFRHCVFQKWNTRLQPQNVIVVLFQKLIGDFLRNNFSFSHLKNKIHRTR